MRTVIAGLLLLASALGAGCRAVPEPHTFPAYARAPLARDRSIVLAPGFVTGQRFVFEDHPVEGVGMGGLGLEFEFLHSGVYEIVAAESGIPVEIRATFDGRAQRDGRTESTKSLAGEAATFHADPTGDIEVDYPDGAQEGGLLRQRVAAIGRTLIDRPLYLPRDGRQLTPGDEWETTTGARRTRSRLVAVREHEGARIAEIVTATKSQGLEMVGFGGDSTAATIFCDVATGALLVANVTDSASSPFTGAANEQSRKRTWRAKRITSPGASAPAAPSAPQAPSASPVPGGFGLPQPPGGAR